jgi:hypothetical protein
MAKFSQGELEILAFHRLQCHHGRLVVDLAQGRCGGLLGQDIMNLSHQTWEVSRAAASTSSCNAY